jgi:hypothetical protein
MKTLTTSLFAIAGGALLAVGCGGSDAPSVAPTISIVSPASNASATLGTDAQLSLSVMFTTTNFVLMPINSIGCGVGCGHVDLLIDGSACNTGVMGYNNEGSASPLDARFGACATPAGNHMLTVELHNNDGSPLRDSSNKPVAQTIALKTQTGNSGVPSIAISSPTAGQTVTLGMDVNKSLPITFTTQNFTLASPGTSGCASGCGHVNILIDGTACNAMGKTYNATGSASPLSALFGLCASGTGVHTVTLELHNDDDTLVNGAAAATVNVTAQ